MRVSLLVLAALVAGCALPAEDGPRAPAFAPARVAVASCGAACPAPAVAFDAEGRMLVAAGARLVASTDGGASWAVADDASFPASSAPASPAAWVDEAGGVLVARDATGPAERWNDANATALPAPPVVRVRGDRVDALWAEALGGAPRVVFAREDAGRLSRVVVAEGARDAHFALDAEGRAVVAWADAEGRVLVARER